MNDIIILKSSKDHSIKIILREISNIISLSLTQEIPIAKKMEVIETAQKIFKTLDPKFKPCNFDPKSKSSISEEYQQTLEKLRQLNNTWQSVGDIVVPVTASSRLLPGHATASKSENYKIRRMRLPAP